MGKSEQMIQNELYSKNVNILDKYECFSLGATTVSNLMKTKVIKEVTISNKFKNKKPDVLILDSLKNIIIYQEQKIPNKFKTEQDIKNAINQEINVARELKAKIYIVSDGELFIWINPLTGNEILDEEGNKINLQVKPKENSKQIVKLINSITLSIDYNNDKILKKEYLDPTDLAQKTNKILKNLTFSSSKMSLYTFVELFLFKYLSDIGVLKEEDSFDYISNLYKKSEVSDGNSSAKILGKYLNGAREKMGVLFPSGKDGTSIINGQVFHIKPNKFGEYESIDSTDKIFKEVILEFKKYEEQNGKFLNISKDFKSKLFETFMKNSDDKSDMGQFFTPLKIVDEMINMVEVREGMTIGDPACGVGKFLLGSLKNKIFDYYNYSNKKLEKKINLIGYEKMMSEKDDITMILAKANMLIYFSEFFKIHNTLPEVRDLADKLLNDTFILRKSLLGTLEKIETEKYDLILANPPYFQSKIMMEAAKNTGEYNLGGSGVEALFLEWILKSLKKGGVANIVLPDGIFSNYANKKLKEYLLIHCFIESIISLPVNSFFNTPKKTYILTIKKKTEKEILENKKQSYPVFTYIANSIGETLDTYRFDSPNDNELKVAVTKYNFYRNSNKNNLIEPIKSYLLKDKKLKLLKIDEFVKDKSWIIENWWAEEEKIEIGLKKKKKILNIDEFEILIDDIISLMQDFKEEIKCLK